MAFINIYPILDIDHVGVTSMCPPRKDLDGLKFYHGYYAFDPNRSLIGEAI
jgi:hypothetical protein